MESNSNSHDKPVVKQVRSAFEVSLAPQTVDDEDDFFDFDYAQLRTADVINDRRNVLR